VKAVVLHEVGGPLELEDVPEPDGAVLDVRAAGVNFADVLIRRGLYPQMPELPYVLGNEVAGELDGRRVVAFTRAGGGYAGRAAIDPDWTFDLPDGASFTAAAAFLTTYLTAYAAVQRSRNVRTVLVHAGSGGVGTASIQLWKHFNTTVYATASTDAKREVAARAGADHVLGYDEIAELRVDFIVDPVGGLVFTQSLPLLNPLGTIAAIGFTAGQWEDPSVQWLVGRNVSVMGVYLGRLMKLEPELVREWTQQLLEYWEDGVIDPVVGATIPLADAGAAHELIETRRHVGKVVLEP
jgi:NADPH2:quinone reductase